MVNPVNASIITHFQNLEDPRIERSCTSSLRVIPPTFQTR